MSPPAKPLRPIPSPTGRSRAARALDRRRPARPRTRLPRHPRRPLRRIAPTTNSPAISARAASDAFLKSQGLDPAAFQHVTYPAAHWDGPDSLAGKYFLERLPIGAASALFERNRPIQVWMTRYFKSLDQEEITVSIHPETARVTGFGHTIPETRPGADITPEHAREIADQFAASLGWDTGAMDLKESSTEIKKARRDHSLEWEARPGDPRNVDETHWRVEINVAGDRVVSARGFWKLPEAWQRGREQENALAITIAVLKIVTLAGLIVYGMWLLIQGTRHGIVRWRAAIRLALPATLLFPVAPLLSVGLMLKNYRTDVPLETFQALAYVSIAMGADLRLPPHGRRRRPHRHLLSRCPARAAPRQSRRHGLRCHRRPARRRRHRPSRSANSRASWWTASTPRPCSPSPARTSSPAPPPPSPPSPPLSAACSPMPPCSACSRSSPGS